MTLKADVSILVEAEINPLVFFHLLPLLYTLLGKRSFFKAFESIPLLLT